jgi:AcrR family transcriptional regulator
MADAVSDLRPGRRGLKRERIIQEAARCLNGQGVSQTSLASIARSVGISRAALYYYVEDQPDLVFQCYRQACEVKARRLSAARKAGGGALDIIEAFIDSMLTADQREIAVLSEIAYLHPEQRETVTGLHDGIMAQLCDVLAEGIKRGQVRPLAIPIVAQAIVALVSWIPLARRWSTLTSLTTQQLRDGVKTICLNGLTADRSASFDYERLELPEPVIAVKNLFDNERLVAAKHEALLAAASWHFNIKGIEATSLEEIAHEVGVTPKVIYHNVGDKETLVTGCYRRAFDFYLSLAERAQRCPGTRMQAVCAVAHALAESTLREEIAPLTPLAGFDSMPRPVQREIREAAARLLARHTDTYLRGQAEGSMRRFDIRAVLSVRHAIHEWLPKWYGDASAETKALIPAELAEFTRLGLAPA